MRKRERECEKERAAASEFGHVIAARASFKNVFICVTLESPPPGFKVFENV